MDVRGVDLSGSRRRAVRRAALHVAAAAAALTSLVAGVAVAEPAAASTRATGALGDARDLLRRVAPRAVDLGVPTAGESTALVATESGLVVGTTRYPMTDQRVFRWRGGQARLLMVGGSLGTGVSQVPSDVNERGQVLVTVRPADDGRQAFVVAWGPDGKVLRVSERGVPSIGVGITEGGDVALNVETAQGRGVRMWRDGELVDVSAPGHEYVAYAVDDRGQVTGEKLMPDLTQRAFLWRDGRLVELPIPPGAVSSIGHGFTEDGAVHGTVEMSEGRTRDVVWVDGGAPVDRVLPCADSRQVQVAEHLPAGLRDRWPGGLGTVVLDECPPEVVRTPRGGPGYVLGGNGRGVHVGFGFLAGTEHRDAVAWVHGLAVPLQELGTPAAAGAVALDVSERGQVVGQQLLRRAPGEQGPWATAVMWWLTPSDPRR